MTTAIPVEIRISSGSNHDCAIRNSTVKMSIAAITMTEKGGVAPSWLVSTITSSPYRSRIAFPRAFWSIDFGTTKLKSVYALSAETLYVTPLTSWIALSCAISTSRSSGLTSGNIAFTSALCSWAAEKSDIMISSPCLIRDWLGRYFVMSLFTFTRGTSHPQTSAMTTVKPNNM